jgi:hypothetical protein
MQSKFTKGLLFAWVPLLLFAVPVLIMMVREVSSQKATGLGAVAGVLSEFLTSFGMLAVVVCEVYGVILLVGTLSKERFTPDTLAELSYPVPWNAARFVRVLHQRAERGEKVWTGAYLVGTGGVSTDKAEYIADLLTRTWQQRAQVRPPKGSSLAAFAKRLLAVPGWGSFMVGQVIADTKYTPLLAKASDRETWATSGPGSKRGLNRVLGRPKDAPWREEDWLKAHTEVRAKLLQDKTVPWVDAQDLQNSECEYDKWKRVQLGEGTPRSLYPGKA